MLQEERWRNHGRSGIRRAVVLCGTFLRVLILIFPFSLCLYLYLWIASSFHHRVLRCHVAIDWEPMKFAEQVQGGP